MSGLTYGSLFSGVGGFDLGLERAGWRPMWQVEIDPQARSVLRRHWPDVALHEDVRDVGRSNLARVDLICGGFPCQDLSVAGRRAGLAGERSGLFYEFMRVVDELAPRWVLIENVPGLLSSNEGRDMGAVLGTLGELGYGWTYRIVDAQHFGVPQRRRRVFIVGRAGGFCPPEILLEPSSLPGDSPAREAAGKGAAEGSPSRIAGACSADEPGGVVDALMASMRKGPGHNRDGHVVAHTLRAEGFDASEDGTDRGTPIVAFDTTQITSKANRSNPQPGDPCHPLAAGAHPPAIAVPQDVAHQNGGGQVAVFQSSQSGVRQVEAHATLDSNNGSRRHNGVIQHAIPRRLTPRECERLQGFPDDWTRYADDGRGIADGPRYRMLGNAVAVPCAEWIGRRIAATTQETVA